MDGVIMAGFAVACFVCFAIMCVCLAILLFGATFLAITEIVVDIKENIERMIE